MPASASAVAPTSDGAPASDAAQDDGALQDIVVTAQRRTENSQDVPIAITAFGSDQIDRLGLKSSQDLPNIVPGLSSAPTAIRGFFYLRGIGSNSNNSSPSVLSYVDGVLQTFNPPVDDFSDVEQISVIKGPQGTLFGRNATGGVIQITTANPLKWQGADLEVGYANYDTVSVKMKAATRLADNVGVGLAGYYVNQDDGWGKNLFDGSDVFTTKRYGVRAKIVAELDDTLTATISADYAYNAGQAGVAFVPALSRREFFDGTSGTFTIPGRFNILQDVNSGGSNKLGGVSLTLEKHLGGVKLLSISSYRQAKEQLWGDQDGSPAPFVAVTVDATPRKSFTQELQISGGDSAFNWVAGLYYYYFKEQTVLAFSGLFPTVTFPILTPPGVPFVVVARPVTNAYAGYAQTTVEVLPDTNVTLGARYTIEKKAEEGFTTGSPILSPGAGSDSTTFRKPSFRVSLDHRFSSEFLAYASYNRGFNAGFYNNSSVGGFNNDTVPPANPVVRPEKIDAYEIGFKSDLLNRRLQINVAAFRYDYSNLQQQIIDVGQLFTVNAASARIKGIDIDITARPTRALTLSLSGNYLDTQYLSYPRAPNYTVQPNGAFVRDPLPQDARGNKLVQSPKFSLQAIASHRLNTDIGTFDATASLHYQTRMFADPQNAFPIAARTLINLSEQWTSNDERTRVTLWVKNLTDKDYDVTQTLVDPVGLVGTPGAPRTYGVSVGRSF